MRKQIHRLFGCALALLLLFTALPVFGDEAEPPAPQAVQCSYFLRNININGTSFKNYYLEDPVLLYRNYTYLPLSEELCAMLGIRVSGDASKHYICIEPVDPSRRDLSSRTVKNNLEHLIAMDSDDWTVIWESDPAKEYLESLQDPEQSPTLLESALQILTLRGDLSLWNSSLRYDEAAFSVLHRDGVFYLPLRLFTDNAVCGWSAYYDEYSGVYISTDPEVEASSLWDSAESDYNRGLTDYILSVNRSLSRAAAEELVFLFKHEADVNQIETTLLMALAQRESSFQAGLQNRQGATGIMQIMLSTGARYELSEADLFDAHKNIEFGSWYIAQHLQNFGSEILALSAYNQGGGAVSRGHYRTTYANRVLETKETIQQFLSSKGYI